MKKVRQVVVVLYDKVDTLDFTGPHDVFGVAGSVGGDFRVGTVSEKGTPVTTVSGITITPRYGFEQCPTADILIVPGGLGSRTEIANERLIAWIREAAVKAELVLSVCTGALLLAQAGLLEGLRVTTNRTAYELLRSMVSSQDTTVVEDVRYVDNGRIVTSGGVTSGFDAALHVVARLCGEARATEVASRLEYAWHAELDIRRAGTEDVEAIRGLLVGAAQWIRQEVGLLQWREERFTGEYVAEWMQKSEMFVASMNGRTVGCFAVQWGYEEIWGELNSEEAGYFHKFAVSRECQSMGIGTRLINWAEGYVGDRGKTRLRLDCMGDNPALNRYYVRQGFAFCGRYDGQGWAAHLYERSVGGVQTDAKRS
ncbi:GNAT family N-acetyltransferase [Paenibacillus whitsoniae]|uniref:GNAT family N-acetyltransferase n=1 Tax=Paenibacillus whitsoniae TaxID=2496558 RepID=A0A3S0A0H7_9BACL|nr:GNAT family N-acetyltransferase [Paenibacillus whitsoniae]RTE04348.1 GNAT family N-acetyltransferase [Paenibacillus whitsoniae]